MNRLAAVVLGVVISVTPVSQAAAGDRVEKLDGYAEWVKDGALVVDGQRVRPAPGFKFKGHGEATSFARIPLGYEVKVKGVRAADGTLVATEVEAKPNGMALFENDLREAFDQTEQDYLRRGRVYEEDDDGNEEVIGRLRTRGAQVERVRRIFHDILPPYLDPEDFRVYVVENDEWNAMAAPNGSIYVFSGLLRDLDDDELAIILGHELAHATHEHGRKGFKKQLPVLLGAAVVAAAAEGIDNGVARGAVQVGAFLFASAVSSGYGRQHEDQADRTGLRYAFEGGYDVSRGPHMWNRFAEKYGNGNKVVNFFFSDHAQSRVRASNLDVQLALNYTGADRPSGAASDTRHADRRRHHDDADRADAEDDPRVDRRRATDDEEADERADRRGHRALRGGFVKSTAKCAGDDCEAAGEDDEDASEARPEPGAMRKRPAPRPSPRY